MGSGGAFLSAARAGGRDGSSLTAGLRPPSPLVPAGHLRGGRKASSKQDPASSREPLPTVLLHLSLVLSSDVLAPPPCTQAPAGTPPPASGEAQGWGPTCARGGECPCLVAVTSAEEVPARTSAALPVWDVRGARGCAASRPAPLVSATSASRRTCGLPPVAGRSCQRHAPEDDAVLLQVTLDLMPYENVVVRRALDGDAALLEKLGIPSVPSCYLIYPNGSHGPAHV